MRGAGLARARTSRRRGVRSSGDHGQACVAVRRDRRGERDHDATDDGAVRGHPRRGRPERRRCRAATRCNERGHGECSASGSVADPSPCRGSPIISCGPRTRRRSPATTDRWCSPTTCSGSSRTCASSTPGSCARPTSRASPTAPASPARTRAAWARSSTRRPEHGVGAHRGRRRRGRHDARRSRCTPGDLVLVHAGVGHRAGRGGVVCLVRGPTSSTRSSRATSAMRVRCSPISPRSAAAKATTSRVPAIRRRSPGQPRPTSTPRRRRWRRGSPPAVGCSRSATAAARRTRRRSPRCSPDRRGAGRCRRAAWSRTTAVVTALGNDVGFDLVFSRQLIAHGRAGDIALGFSTSGGSRNVLTAFAEARARGMLTRRSGRLRRRRDGRIAATSTTAWSSLGQRPPHPGDPGRARLRPVGRRCRQRAGRPIDG